MTVVILFIFVIVAVFFLIMPYGKRYLWKYGIGADALKLQERKEAALIAMHDVDFEYAAGKMTEEDFNQLRKQYKEEAVTVLREIDGDVPLGSEKALTGQLKKDLKKEVGRLKKLKEVGI
jgi:hypothetical protein